MKTDCTFYNSPRWHAQVKAWRQSGLITVARPATWNDLAKLGFRPKSNRVPGQATNEIRAFALKHKRFTTEQIETALNVRHVLMVARLHYLVKVGELESSAGGKKGANLRPIYSATPKLKIP